MTIQTTSSPAAPEKRRAVFWRAATLLGALLVWAVLAWPVPRFFASGIPASPYTAEERQERTLILGDHIQLLYHFWLARDMISGGTPAFADIYEFNTDSTDPVAETARVRRFDPYYAPFSWIYAAVSPLFGDAAGWNTAVLLSVLLGAAGLFALARRHTVSDGSAFIAAMVATAFPYRWFTLHSGSPTGFAMGLAPFVPLGLDIAVRDKRIGGGVIAGLALFFAYCSDLHVFYFSAISAPLWCVFSWLCQPRDNPRTEFGRIALALLPAILLAAAAALAGTLLNGNFTGTDMAGGRHWREMQNFSPRVRELFHSDAHGHIFMTFSIPALFLLCLAGRLFRGKEAAREGGPDPLIGTGWVLALLAVTAVGVVMLALGASGLHRGAPIHAARILIPKYTMIRQPAKILCLMPSLIAIAIAIAMPLRRRHPYIHAVAIALALLAVLEARSAMRPSISLLPREQPVYAAIADDAASRALTPHALAIPLWPGDSHWSSMYLYGAMRSRVRLVNGYSPAKRDDYVENVFGFYEPMNEGEADDGRLDSLAADGVRYVVLHEDAFPEKVSPHPASATLRRFMENPRLSLIAHDGPAWAFHILDAPMAIPAGYTWGQAVESISTVNRKARSMEPLPVLGLSAEGAIEFPAADMFHGCETIPETGAVRIDDMRDPVSAAIYGPNRELPAGTYTAELVFTTDAPAGTHLGNFSVRTSKGVLITEAPVLAGAKCAIDGLVVPAEPIRFEFNYNRSAPLEIERIKARRATP